MWHRCICDCQELILSMDLLVQNSLRDVNYLDECLLLSILNIKFLSDLDIVLKHILVICFPLSIGFIFDLEAHGIQSLWVEL